MSKIIMTTWLCIAAPCILYVACALLQLDDSCCIEVKSLASTSLDDKWILCLCLLIKMVPAIMALENTKQNDIINTYSWKSSIFNCTNHSMTSAIQKLTCVLACTFSYPSISTLFDEPMTSCHNRTDDTYHTAQHKYLPLVETVGKYTQQFLP